jgi:methylmalonyl-CoA mutase
VNKLRSTTEAFAALVGGADALTTRGFDEAIGASDAFARRIARNTQTILNEESHLTHVADPAGGSYYVETLTDQLARAGWAQLQAIEARGGMDKVLLSGALGAEIAETARSRAAAIAKRSAPITGVSEFANLNEAALERAPLGTARSAETAPAVSARVSAALTQLTAAAPKRCIAAAIDAAGSGAGLAAISGALDRGAGALRLPAALPLRRHAEPFEALRARSDRHAAASGHAPSVFLCNLGAIAQHKPRAAFASGFLNAGGVRVLDNDGFASPEAARDAFKASGARWAVICGSDEQYAEQAERVAGLLREAGAKEILLAGRPGEREAAYQKAGISAFIYLGLDVISTLGQLFDRNGVAP